jgi:hypothetical protein
MMPCDRIGIVTIRSEQSREHYAPFPLLGNPAVRW